MVVFTCHYEVNDIISDLAGINRWRFNFPTWMVLALYTVPVFMVNLYTGPTFGMAQSLAPLAMRAAASALLLFIINMIGLVFGPTTIGVLSDLFQSMLQWNADVSLQRALLFSNLVYLLSFWFYFLASKTLKSDLDASARPDLQEAST